ncbi:MAG: hypothetical protein AAF206_11165, partial [Bacteroidota bacterium]
QTRKRAQQTYIYLGGFLSLFALSIWTLQQYVSPSSEIYTNTRTHSLSHLGYQFGDSLYLADGRLPERALMDDQSGELALIRDSLNTSFRLNATDFFEPVYLEKDAVSFQLAFADDYSLAFTDSIQVFQANQEQLRLVIQPFAEGDSCHYIVRTNGQRTMADTSLFTQPIKTGYNLSDIVLNTHRPQRIGLDLEGSLLLREVVRSPLKAARRLDVPAPLRFFPGKRLLEGDSIRIVADGEIHELSVSREHSILVSDTMKMFTGLGRRRSPVLQLISNDSLRELRFAFPRRHPLKSDNSPGTEIHHFITSQAAEIQQFHQTADSLAGGYYFNYFLNDDNLNHISAELRYTIGESRAPLDFRLLDNRDLSLLQADGQREVHANEVFTLGTLRNDLQWLMQFEDHRSGNPLQVWHIYAFLSLLCFLVFFRYLVIGTEGYLSRVEMAMYVVVFCFLFVRVLLQWRISTFPPLEQIDYRQYQVLIEGMFGHFSMTVILSSTFFLIWFAILIRRNFWGWEARMDHHVMYAALAMGISVFFLAVANVSFFERIANLFMPLSLYYLFDIQVIRMDEGEMLQKQNSWTRRWMAGIREWVKGKMLNLELAWEKKAESIEKEWRQNLLQTLIGFVGDSRRAFEGKAIGIGFLYWLNVLANRIGFDIFENRLLVRGLIFLGALVYIALNDAGYAIMFLLFAFLHFGLAYIITRKDNIRIPFLPGKMRQGQHTHWLLFASALILLGGVIYFQNTLINWLLDGDHLYYVVGVLILLILPGFWYLQQRFEWFYLPNPTAFTKGIRTKGILSIAAFFFLVLGWSVGKEFFAKRVDHYSYIRYRAGILDTSISDLVMENEFASRDTRQIQRSSHNQWLINFYLSAGKGKDHYFELQPHFTQGATHITQASDLVVPRYLIAEHSEWVVLLLMGLLLSLTLIYVGSLKDRMDPVHFSLMGIPLLLFTTAFFVWMTATNRFTFFGQDFPLIPVASKITLLLTFGLLLLLLVFYEPAGNERDGIMMFPKRPANQRKQIRSIVYWLGGLGICLFLYSTNRNSDTASNSDHYDISKVIDDANLTLDDLNRRFVQYQQQHRDDLATTSIDSLLARFHRLDPQGRIQANDLSQDEAGPFIRTAYRDHFIKQQRNKRNPEALIHVRKRGDFQYLTLNRRYFFIKSPESEANQWKGSLLAANTALKSGLINQKREMEDLPFVNDKAIVPNLTALLFDHQKRRDNLYQNIVISVIPSTWTADRKKLYLSRIKGESRDGEGINKAYFTLENGTLSYASWRAVGMDSSVLVGEKNQAIRLMPNDHLTLRYPEGERFKGSKRLRFVEENRFHLAKNMWINGKQRLYYPLGKSFSWSYSFSNLLSQVQGQEINAMRAANQADSVVALRHQNRSVSIDYRLTENVHNLMAAGANPGRSAAKTTSAILNFRNASFAEKQIGVEGIRLVYRDGKNLIAPLLSDQESIFEEKAKNYQTIIEQVNDRLLKDKRYVDRPDHQLENDRLNDAINAVISSRYDMSVVAIDGNGRVRLMVDYHKTPKADPNNIRQYYAFLNQLYLSSTTALEKDYFGNRNLLKTDVGVGSTFKPIVYASVSSQAKLDWANLSIKETTAEELAAIQEMNRKTGKPELKHFAGERFPHQIFWNSISPGDYVNEGLQAKNYLAKSNNIYHSSVFFLGSFPVEDLRRNLNTEVLKPYPGLGKLKQNDSIAFNWPVLNYGGQKVFRQWPNFNTDASAMAMGLYNNFDLLTANDQKDDPNLPSQSYQSFGSRTYQRAFARGAKAGNSYFYWSFPEWSDFVQSDREAAPKTRKGLINPALGAYPVHVSPIKMAEMSLRLFSMNRNMELSLDDRQSKPQAFAAFDHDRDWGSDEKLFKFYRDHIYASMHNTIQNGTASGLLPLAKSHDGQYWLYAKTGTTGNSEKPGERNIRGKRLMVVIANRPIHQSNYAVLSDANLRKETRLYSVFLSVDNVQLNTFNAVYGGTWAGAAPILTEIMQSETFLQYMQSR